MRELISKAGLTQVELAKKLNVTQSLVSQWVRRKCEPRIEVLPLLSQILNVSVEKIIDCFAK